MYSYYYNPVGENLRFGRDLIHKIKPSKTPPRMAQLLHKSPINRQLQSPIHYLNSLEVESEAPNPIFFNKDSQSNWYWGQNVLGVIRMKDEEVTRNQLLTKLHGLCKRIKLNNNSPKITWLISKPL